MDLYFKNKTARIIFGLAELKGKQQMDFLAIHFGHYQSKELAKKWYEELKGKITNSNHPKLDTAIKNLEKLYKGMK